MKLTFLGTGAMVPTKERNVQGMYLEYEGEGILIDCGEGTQRQMSIAGISRQKIKKILISHWHGDHIAGLLGLIQTLGNVDEPTPITLYGPVGSNEYFSHLLQTCAFDLRADISVIELTPPEDGQTAVIFFENDRYFLEAVSLEHSIDCIGYSLVEKDKRKIDMDAVEHYGLSQGPQLGLLQRGETIELNGKTITPDDVGTLLPGKKISFVLDTEMCAGLSTLASNADVLVSEATYESTLEDKAEQYKHLSAQTVAQVANQMGVGRLVLTHFSQRYKTVDVIEEDAKKIFPDVLCAYDFLTLDI